LPDGFLRAHPYLRGDIVVQGRSSTIYEGHDSSLDRDVALKVMLPQSQAHAQQVLNFIREAQVTSQLQHPNILPIYELSLDDEKQLFYTTRFMSGDTLARYLEKLAAGDAPTVRRFSLAILVAIFQKVCDGVAFAHAHGVVHGALRPENITVGDFGEVFVMNWTFATILSPAEGEKGGSRVHAPPAMESPPLSAYSAAVQVRGGHEGIDVSVDIHALGGILFKILTLHDPVTGNDDAQMIARILSGHVAIPASLSRTPRPHWPDGRLPEYLVGVALKALNTSDPDRPTNVLELQERIAAW
jgi:serine/threonine protein kinase